MEENREVAIKRIHEVAETLRYPSPQLISGQYAVHIKGLSERSREALLGRNMVVRHFPFRIGRYSRSDPFSSLKQDLSLPDSGRYGVSRMHFSIERRGDKMVLVDEKSTVGSWVNSELLGKRAGGRQEIELKPGKNEVILGRLPSPFIFEMQVTKDGEGVPDANYVRCGGHIFNVMGLYARLCHLAKDILTSSGDSLPSRVNAAMDAIESIAAERETVDTLYCYSAHPDTFSDVIVAHSVNVAIYVVKLFASLSYRLEDIIKIGTAALLHDIGMYAVPEKIVYKKESVSPKELGIIKEHTQIGSEMLSTPRHDYRFYPDMALEHHERVNGSGYPKGLRNISEITELMGLVDFFEAVTHHRPQRGPVTPHDGVQIIMNSGEGNFSRNALKSFINVFSLFPAYSVVRLNSGEIGQVVKTNTNWPLRPIIKILFEKDGRKVEQGNEIDLLYEKDLYITKDISDRVFVDRFFKL